MRQNYSNLFFVLDKKIQLRIFWTVKIDNNITEVNNQTIIRFQTAIAFHFIDHQN